MAYDPSRKSLIVFGGLTYPSASYDETTRDLCDTWEWSSATARGASSLPRRARVAWRAGMVTDSGRAKLLLFGGDVPSNAVWEWDGAKTTWTNRTPTPGNVAPVSRGGTGGGPLMAFDDGRQKMFLFEGDSTWQGTTSNSVFWEWIPVGRMGLRDSGDFVDLGTPLSLSWPTIACVAGWSCPPTQRTWWAPRRTSRPGSWIARARPGTCAIWPPVQALCPRPRLVLQQRHHGLRQPARRDGAFRCRPRRWFRPERNLGIQATSLGNGEGCTAPQHQAAPRDSAWMACAAQRRLARACASRAVSRGRKAPARWPHQAPKSVEAVPTTGVRRWRRLQGQNGTACSSANACASGVCADGVCCDSPCDGTCVSCNQVGRMGKCSPFTAGSDPQNECGLGSDVCRSTCNGAGACDYPQAGTPCGPCQVCDGNGVCWLDSTPYLCSTGGTGEEARAAAVARVVPAAAASAAQVRGRRDLRRRRWTCWRGRRHHGRRCQWIGWRRWRAGTIIAVPVDWLASPRAAQVDMLARAAAPWSAVPVDWLAQVARPAPLSAVLVGG